MAIRCKYCGTLIIHRFNRNYNRMDKRRKYRHERACNQNPENVKRRLRIQHYKASLLKKFVGENYD